MALRGMVTLPRHALASSHRAELPLTPPNGGPDMTRRFARMTLVLAIAVTSIAGSISPASAAFSDDPDTTWMTNGIVYSVATGGDRVYLGGKFKSLRRCPTGVTCPDGTIKTVNVGALNATTGEGVRTFKVTVAGDGAI